MLENKLRQDARVAQKKKQIVYDEVEQSIIDKQKAITFANANKTAKQIQEEKLKNPMLHAKQEPVYRNKYL